MSYGLALDIGTTTLEAYIIDLNNNCIVEHIHERNEQYKYGLDVLSRLEYSSVHSANELKSTITNQIKNISKIPIEKAVISGNTTMLYLLLGIDTSPMNIAPFKINDHLGLWLSNILGINKAYFPKCPSAFIGADIVSGMVACNISNLKNALYIDIGTNCEIVLKKGEKYIGCSVAAGPALEGGQTQCGTIACDGAIDRCNTVNGKLIFNTVNDKQTTGICGSGYIDALVGLKQLNLIDENGYLSEDYYFTEDVFISQKDVHSIILAKASIFSGINTLLKITDTNANELDAVYLSGGICNGLNLINAGRIGLIPNNLINKISIIKNACLEGCKMQLLNKNIDLTPKITTIQLAHLELYKQEFISNCKL